MFVFNSSGLLVPDKKITCSFQDFENEFVKNISSRKREEIFELYVKYNNDFKQACGGMQLLQWINGSFVTKKSNPGDIDLVTFLNYELVKNIGIEIERFKYPNSEKIYGVDAYIVEIYPVNHKNNFRYLADLAYWTDHFSKTRRIRGNKLAKGFLEIKF